MDHSELSSRLVPLSDGRPGLRGTMHVEICEPPSLDTRHSTLTGQGDGSGSPSDPSTLDPEHSPVLDFVSSDETIDRCGEIIQAGGWKLSSYPPPPASHNPHPSRDL